MQIFTIYGEMVMFVNMPKQVKELSLFTFIRYKS